jgi:hypothetical protein
MKKIILGMIMAFTISAGMNAQTTAVKVGTVNNNELTITNTKFLNDYFNNRLGNSGTLGESEIVAAPIHDRFIITYKETNNKMSTSSIGLMLVVNGTDAFVLQGGDTDAGGPGGGGSISFTCSGDPCNSCYPSITWPAGNWFPNIKCNCSQSGTGNKCNMSMTGEINVNVN